MTYEGGDNGNGRIRLVDATQEEPEPRLHWENLGSLRLWLGSFAFAILMFVVASMLGLRDDTWLQVILFASFAISMIGGVAKGRYWCPYCRGRVKPGATVCTRCGREFEI